MWLILRSLEEDSEEMSQEQWIQRPHQPTYSFWPSKSPRVTRCNLFAKPRSELHLTTSLPNTVAPSTPNQTMEPPPPHLFFGSWIMPSWILFVWKVYYIHIQSIQYTWNKVYILIRIWIWFSFCFSPCHALFGVSVECECVIDNRSLVYISYLLFLLFWSMAGNLMARVVQLCLTYLHSWKGTVWKFKMYRLDFPIQATGDLVPEIMISGEAP